MKMKRGTKRRMRKRMTTTSNACAQLIHGRSGINVLNCIGGHMYTCISIIWIRYIHVSGN